MKAILLTLMLSCLLVQATFAQEARPSSNTGSGFFVKNGTVYDPTGHPFIPMGYNAATFWAGNGDCKKENMRTHIPASGANAVRIVSQTQGAFGWNANPTEQRALLELAVEAKLVPMLEMHDATCSNDAFQTVVDYWTSPAMIRLCQDFEPYLWVNIANEHNFPSFEAWRDTYIAVIGQFREAGIKNLIVVDAGHRCGQDPSMFHQYGQQVLEADPEQNVLFSIHMYGFWRTQDRSFTNWTPPFSVEADLPALKATGLPIILGEFGWDTPAGGAGNYDSETLLQTCLEQGVGWYYWSFFDKSDKPYYSVVKDVCGGIGAANLTPSGQYLIPYLQEHAQTASVYTAVSLAPAPARERLKAFPNPTTGRLYLEGIPFPCLLRVYDLQGRVVKQATLLEAEVDVSDLGRGLYRLQLITPEGIQNSRLMKR